MKFDFDSWKKLELCPSKDCDNQDCRICEIYARQAIKDCSAHYEEQMRKCKEQQKTKTKFLNEAYREQKQLNTKANQENQKLKELLKECLYHVEFKNLEYADFKFVGNDELHKQIQEALK